MDYSDFSVEDLASDERFINWVKNDSTEAEHDFWRLLVLSNPRLQDKIDRARILVVNVDRAEDGIHPVSPEKVRQIWQNVLVAMNDGGAPDVDEAATELLSRKPRKISRLPGRKGIFALAVAASLALLISTIPLFQDGAPPANEWYSYTRKAPGFIEFVNTAEKPLELALNDGTVISLESDSRVKYKKDYTSDTIRKVYLQGEAFFKVARDPQKPFVVLTNDVATEVLGTSFRIREDASTKNVVVKVKSGKVSVYSVKDQSVQLNDPKDGVILLPNQEVIYSGKDGLFEKKIVDTPELLAVPSDGSFIFKNTPIDSVFGKLEEAYGVEILFDRETMRNCFITVALESEPLSEKLKVICRTVGASYEIIDAKVVIKGGGCKTINRENLNE